MKKTSQIAAAWSRLVLQIRKNLWLHRNHDFPYGSARIDVCGLLGLRNGKSGPPVVTIRTASDAYAMPKRNFVLPVILTAP
ncbi:MAG: hypothetical protein DME71_10035 [Verrucomicrobia bacterium]|nr:MAG: hypothetical protein DME71_10035 [Verrucomicrobiota bacterium]